MFHFSADRLAGLDATVLKIAPPKVPSTLIHVPARKLRKQRPRPPLADKNNRLAPPPPDSAPVYISSLPCPPSFRPLPPLPSASTLELPSFLHFSDQSFASVAADPLARISEASFPASALFRVSSSPISSSRRVVVRKTRNNKVSEGPQWIPAFHHPNSPYVPWSTPVRRRILPPPSPLSPSPVCPSSPRIRSGAVAPEPWASSTFSQTHAKSKKEKLSGSWKSFRNSIKQGVKTVVSRLGKSSRALRILCTSDDMLRTYDDTDVPAKCMAPDAVRSAPATMCCADPRDSVASLVSSDSKTLAAWLAERRADACSIADGVMSVAEYELMGSWLDVRSCDNGWVCGIQDCDMHTAGGSPYVASEYSDGLRMAMPFDSADLLSEKHPLPKGLPVPFAHTPPRFRSLPRLSSQSTYFYSQHAQLATPNGARRHSTGQL